MVPAFAIPPPHFNPTRGGGKILLIACVKSLLALVWFSVSGYRYPIDQPEQDIRVPAIMSLAFDVLETQSSSHQEMEETSLPFIAYH